MTTPEQFGRDLVDLLAMTLLFVVPIVAAALWLEGRTRSGVEPEILPPPQDGRSHNLESIAEYRRKRAAIDRCE